MRLVFLFLYCIWGYGASVERKNAALGPFDMILNHIEGCHEAGNGNIEIVFKTKKFNRTSFTLDLEGAFKIPIDDSITASVTAAVLTNGGYKNNYWSRDFAKVCSAGRMFIPKVLDGVARASGHPERNCPFPKGNITARNIALSLNIEKDVPMFFYNKYRIDVGLMKHNKLQGCFSMFVDVVPKRSSKG